MGIDSDQLDDRIIAAEARIAKLEAQPAGSNGMALVYAQAGFFTDLYAKIETKNEQENINMFQAMSVAIAGL